jgi:predicted metal-dependent phosphoesterase TrpH
VHSHLSSHGEHSPESLVEMASDRGLKAIAIADHDTMDGYLAGYSAGRRCGVEVIPCVELTATAGNTEVSLLAYFLAPSSPEVAGHLETARRRSRQREALPPTATETIAVIRRNRGVPVLAYAARDTAPETRALLLAELAMAGLCGIEVFSPHHDEDVERELTELAMEFDLEATAGSGFHGGAGPAIGDIPCNDSLELLSRLRRHHHLF